jgi:hypothetical protein
MMIGGEASISKMAETIPEHQTMKHEPQCVQVLTPEEVANLHPEVADIYPRWIKDPQTLKTREEWSRLVNELNLGGFMGKYGERLSPDD